MNSSSLETILNAVAEATGLCVSDIKAKRRTVDVSIARGVYYMIAREYGIHPFVIVAYVDRSRSCCITIAQRYRWYLEYKDKTITLIVKKVREILERSDE